MNTCYRSSKHSLLSILPVVTCLLVSVGCQLDKPSAAQADAGPALQPSVEPRIISPTEHRVIEMTNEFRAEHGLRPLTVNPSLDQASAYFAKYMARTNRYGHTADDKQPWDRAKEHGYDYCLVSENIAYQWRADGFQSAELADRFFTGWKESPDHRDNMLNPHATETAVALAQGESGTYFAVQMFGRPKSMTIDFNVTSQTDVAVQYTLAGEIFDLPPRTARTHQMCVPEELRFQLPDMQTGNPSVPPTFLPTNGQTLVVTTLPGGNLTVIKQ